MKLYKISRVEDAGYDEYVELVVCAESEDAALEMRPSGAYSEWIWPHKDGLTIQDLGIAHDDVSVGIIVASFNAG